MLTKHCHIPPDITHGLYYFSTSQTKLSFLLYGTITPRRLSTEHNLNVCDNLINLLIHAP